MREYFKKQIEEIKESPKSILKKWYLWVVIIIISLILGPIFEAENKTTTPKTTPTEIVADEPVETKANEHIINEESDNNVSEKERQQNIEDTAWTLYATTEQVIKNRLKVPQTAKFSDQKAIFDEEEQLYKISGSVAAENSFGGTVNSTFYAEYNTELNIIYLVFDNETLVNQK